MGEARTEDGSVYFEIHGEGEPLVLICGLTGSIDYYWHSLIAELGDKYQIITFDSRGMGKTKYSDKAFSIGNIADDLSHLLDHLGIDKAHLFGHSMGSVVAQSFSCKYPDRVDGMILCNTFSKLTMRDRTVLEGVLDLLDEKIPHKKIFWFLMPWIFSEDHLSNDLVKEKLKEFYSERELCTKGLRRQIESIMAFDSTKWLEELESKTLVIASKDDIMFPAPLGEKIAKKIPNARLAKIEGGHAAHVEKAPLVSNLIKDFMSS